MKSGASRMIWTSTIRERVAIRQALRSICLAELMAPSRDFWVVAPWISDIPLIRDVAGRFRIVNPLGFETITLASLAGYLLDAGTRATVVTRTDVTPETDRFLRRLADRRTEGTGRLRIVRHPTLHAKGLLGDSYALTGSMNFTWSGLTTNQELVHFHWNTGEVAELRDRFEDEFGSWSEHVE